MERNVDISVEIRLKAESLAAAATMASRANYFVEVEVQLIRRQPIGRTSSLVHGLVPGHPQPSRRQVSKADAVASLTQHMSVGLESVAQSEDLARKFVDLLDSPKAEFFELSDYGTAHPHHGFTFWTFWLLAVDRRIDSCISLALGASD